MPPFFHPPAPSRACAAGRGAARRERGAGKAGGRRGVATGAALCSAALAMTSLRSSGGAVGLAGAVQSADLVVHSLFIVNKSGGLVYHRDFGACARGILDTNETLRLGSIFHSLHAISTQLSPVEGCTGMRALRANNFALHCLQVRCALPPRPAATVTTEHDRAHDARNKVGASAHS